MKRNIKIIARAGKTSIAINAVVTHEPRRGGLEKTPREQLNDFKLRLEDSLCEALDGTFNRREIKVL
jgi:hypothetical protein